MGQPAEQATPEARPDPVWAAVEKALGEGRVTDELRNHLGSYGRRVEQMHRNEITRQRKQTSTT
jgi:hypothetical protein